MRALETAAGAFGAGPFKGEGRPLMLSQTEELDERAPHTAVACPEGIPFIAFEGCRERLGIHACLNLPFYPACLWECQMSACFVKYSSTFSLLLF